MAATYPLNPLVIIPTYNERENIQSLLPEILKLEERLRVLIVDDASPDDTAGAVLALKQGAFADRIFLCRRPNKLGLGSAYVHGFRWGLANGCDFFIQMDADWSHHPRYLPIMLQSAGAADFVIGSRYVSGGGTLHWSAGRRLLSKFGSAYARLILGAPIADFTGGFNGWSAEVLRRLDPDMLRSNGYSFQIEMKYRAWRMKFRHVEFPIIFDERREGASKMSAAIAMEAFYRVWALKLSI